jgi:hypothetical protein
MSSLPENLGFYETMEDIESLPLSSSLLPSSSFTSFTTYGDLTDKINTMIEDYKKRTNESNISKSELDKLNNQIIMLLIMSQYPGISHLENYLLFEEFFSDADLNNVSSTVFENNGVKLFVIPPNISQRRLLSLLLLYSREYPEPKKGFIYTDSEDPIKELIISIIKEIPTPDDLALNSSDIFKRAFIQFFTKDPSDKQKEIDWRMKKQSYIDAVIDGSAMVKIYKEKYLDKANLDESISDVTIKERTKRFLQNPNITPPTPVTPTPPEEEIYELPISYIFSFLTDAEKEIMSNQKEVCEVVKDLYHDGEMIPKMNVKPYFLEGNPSIEEITTYLDITGPKVLDKKIDEKKRERLRSPSRSVPRDYGNRKKNKRGGKKTRNAKNNKNIQKDTKTHKKTRKQSD